MHVLSCKKVGVPFNGYPFLNVLLFPFLLVLCYVIGVLLFLLSFICVRFQSVLYVFLSSLPLQISLFFMSFCLSFYCKLTYFLCLSVLSFAVNQSILFVFLSSLPLQISLFFMSFCLSFYCKLTYSLCLFILFILAISPCSLV